MTTDPLAPPTTTGMEQQNPYGDQYTGAAPSWLNMQDQIQQAYNQAQTDVNSKRQQLYQSFGYVQPSMNPMTGALGPAHTILDTSNQFGQFQKMDIAHGRGVQDATQNAENRHLGMFGLGAAGADSVRNDQHQAEGFLRGEFGTGNSNYDRDISRLISSRAAQLGDVAQQHVGFDRWNAQHTIDEGGTWNPLAATKTTKPKTTTPKPTGLLPKGKGIINRSAATRDRE